MTGHLGSLNALLGCLALLKAGLRVDRGDQETGVANGRQECLAPAGVQGAVGAMAVVVLGARKLLVSTATHGLPGQADGVPHPRGPASGLAAAVPPILHSLLPLPRQSRPVALRRC